MPFLLLFCWCGCFLLATCMLLWVNFLSNFLLGSFDCYSRRIITFQWSFAVSIVLNCLSRVIHLSAFFYSIICLVLFELGNHICNVQLCFQGRYLWFMMSLGLPQGLATWWCIYLLMNLFLSFNLTVILWFMWWFFRYVSISVLYYNIWYLVSRSMIWWSLT